MSNMIQGLYAAMDISATGLTAQRTRMNITAANIANAESTRTEEGGPYRRQQVIFSPSKRASFVTMLQEEHLRIQESHRDHFDNRHTLLSREAYARGVEVAAIVKDPAPPRLIYEPEHPDADANGFVAYPNINMVTEMMNMMLATRAYEANVTALENTKTMMQSALQI